VTEHRGLEPDGTATGYGEVKLARGGTGLGELGPAGTEMGSGGLPEPVARRLQRDPLWAAMVERPMVGSTAAWAQTSGLPGSGGW